ncbi:MAG: hypothetical protein R3Y67_02435 [Eubacteriales bacterium]
MNKIRMYQAGLTLLVLSIVVGCVCNDKVVVETLTQEELGTLSEFANVSYEVSDATSNYRVEDIAKIVFGFSGTHANEIYGIDLAAKELVTEGKTHVETLIPTYKMTDEDVATSWSMIQQYHVLEWSGFYNEDTAIPITTWQIAIQFSDGTTHVVKGVDDPPGELYRFCMEMETFVESKAEHTIDAGQSYMGLSTYIIDESSTGEQIKINLQEDIDHGYILSVRDDLQEVTISKDGEVYAYVFLREYYNSIMNYERDPITIGFERTIERTTKEYPNYILTESYESFYGDEAYRWYYDIRLGETSAGVCMVNLISQESAQEIYELLSFEVIH